MTNDCDNLLLLVGDRRTSEAKGWTRWLRSVPSIRSSFSEWNEDFEPFHYNEAASVAVLANAASKTGFLALTEYVTQKRLSTRGRAFHHGRCDLWVADPATDKSWAFEFKQVFAAAKIRQSTFDKKLAKARADAKAVDRNEADRRVGCLIVVPSLTLVPDRDLISHYDTMCLSSELAFRIGDGKSAVWLSFDFVDS